MSLSDFLKQEHRDAGLELEDDGDYYYLMREEETLHVFHNRLTSIIDIWDIADQWLNEQNNGVTYEKEKKR